MYYITKSDYRSLLRYRALAVDICHQMGLYEQQERLALNPLEGETRKKLLWCQYVLDRYATQISQYLGSTDSCRSFCSALTSLPVLFREEDIQTEYPVDVDDENVTETGFLPTLPGEPTRISSAIALFKATRILSKVLEQLFPSKPSYDVSFAKIRALAGELDEWLQNLPPHLRFKFTQNKPSTNVTSSRSPLLVSAKIMLYCGLRY
jgi:hypothetical protein